MSFAVRHSLNILIILAMVNLLPTPTFAQLVPVEWQQAAGPYGGRYWDIAEDPYTGYIWTRANNRIYFSTDRGESWNYVGLEGKILGGFAFGSEGTIFAGSFRSQDEGESWQRVNLADSISISSLTFHNADNTLLAATKYGVYSSDDDGENWQILTQERVQKVWSAKGSILALTNSDYPEVDKLIQSKDNGESWSTIPTPWTGDVNDYMYTRDGTSYLLMYDYNSERYGLYRSSDLGEPWGLLSSEEFGHTFLGITPGRELIIESQNRIYGYSLETNQASLIFEMPDRNGRFVSSYRSITSSALAADGSIYLYGSDSDFMRTDDLGATFVPLDGTGVIGTAVDQIEIDIESGDIWAGTNGYGVFLSSDQGETWANRGLITYSLSAFSLGNQPGELWAATYRDGLFRSINSGENWHFFESDSLNGQVYDFEYDQAADIRYALLYDDLYYSKDQGESWIGMNVPHDNAGHEQPVEGFVVGPNGDIYARILFGQITGENGLFRTSDLGTTWEMVHEGFFERPWRSKLMFDSSGTLWLGENKFLYRSFDNGITWEEVLSFQTRINALLETPDGSFWIGHYDGLMRSVDGGNTWRDEQENLHDCVLSLAWNEATSELLVGTAGGGVYKGYIDTSIHVDIEEPFESVTETVPLLSSYPNPVLDATQLSFNLAQDTHVRLVLIDQLGRQVSELINTHLTGGTHEINVDFSDLAQGVYFYRLETAAKVQSKSIIHIR